MKLTQNDILQKHFIQTIQLQSMLVFFFHNLKLTNTINPTKKRGNFQGLTVKSPGSYLIHCLSNLGTHYSTNCSPFHTKESSSIRI